MLHQRRRLRQSPSRDIPPHSQEPEYHHNQFRQQTPSNRRQPIRVSRTTVRHLRHFRHLEQCLFRPREQRAIFPRRPKRLRLASILQPLPCRCRHRCPIRHPPRNTQGDHLPPQPHLQLLGSEAQDQPLSERAAQETCTPTHRAITRMSTHPSSAVLNGWPMSPRWRRTLPFSMVTTRRAFGAPRRNGPVRRETASLPRRMKFGGGSTRIDARPDRATV